MLPFGVTILATVPQRSETPEGLINYPVYAVYSYGDHLTALSIIKNTRTWADKGIGMMCWQNDTKREMP
jgi:hypothetical protein